MLLRWVSAGLRSAVRLAPALLLGACAAVQGGALAPRVPFDASAYRGFVVPAPLLPFQARGAARFSLRGERESGELWLQGQPGYLYALELHVPLTGSLGIELRFDRERVLLLDYVNRSYLFSANTPAARLRLFEVDLAPEEFQTLLTGRISEARFAAGHGTREADGTVVLHEGTTEHRFRLGANGLPESWRRSRAGVAEFRVEFRDYLTLPMTQGPPLLVPRQVRLYALGGPGAADAPAVLTLGVHTFLPGSAGAPRLLDALPAGARAFERAELPAPR